jgi:hypothetical protein
MFLKNLTVAQVFKEFRVFHGTRIFITEFRNARHWNIT